VSYACLVEETRQDKDRIDMKRQGKKLYGKAMAKTSSKDMLNTSSKEAVR
jgi:hypothetical protein